ncbi:hypothetical protein YQE_07587, partial [Dendroctonus ponderosae]
DSEKRPLLQLVTLVTLPAINSHQTSAWRSFEAHRPSSFCTGFGFSVFVSNIGEHPLYKMADEYFFALTLKGKNTNEVWDPEAKGAGAEDYQGGHKLIIKQALLGPGATEGNWLFCFLVMFTYESLSLAGEVNVIQVEAMTWKDSVKIPIATLKAGGANNQVLLDLSFPDPPVTFTLIQGSGPVHIVGHHLIGGPIEEFDEMDEMEEEMIEDDEGEEGAEEEEDDEEPKSKKAKTNSVKGKTSAKNNTKAKK